VIRRHQLYRHQPHNEIFGDCQRTALACLLDLEPWEVPHFVQREQTGQASSWDEDQRAFLASRGLHAVDVAFGGELEDVLRYMQERNPGTLYILAGRSPRGTDHAVVACGGGFEWDPHPSGGFLVGPTSNGYYELTFLVPLQFQGAPA
jgi:hypothetical protein